MKHLKIISSFLRISVMNALEYRLDFFSNNLFKLFDSAASFLVIFFLVNTVGQIGQWSKSEILLLDLTFTLAISIFGLILQPGLKQFASDLNANKIDSYLVKPLDLQFFVSFSRWELTNFFRVIFTIFGIVLLTRVLQLEFPIQNIGFYIFTVLLGVAIYYCFTFTIICTILFFGRIRSIEFIPETIWQFGKMPTSIFGRFGEILFTIVAPLFFAATFPVGLLNSRYYWPFLFAELLLVFIFFAISRVVLKIGLTKYSGSGN